MRTSCDLAKDGGAGRPGFGAAHRHLEHDHPQAEAGAARRAHQAGGERNGTASALSSSRSCSTLCGKNGIEPIGYSPIGSPGRPDRDRTPEDTSPTEDPVIRRDRASGSACIRRSVCIKWAVQRGQTPIPFSTNPRNYREQSCGQWSASRLTDAGDGCDRRNRPQLPLDQGPGLSLEGRPVVGRSLGCERGDHARPVKCRHWTLQTGNGLLWR